MSSGVSKITVGSPRGSSKLFGVYQPFAVGIAVVLLVTALFYISTLAKPLGIGRLMSVFMGAFFITFALPKLLNVTAFAKAFRRYDLVGKYLPVYAYAFPFIELGLGIMLLSKLPHNSMVVSVALNSTIALMSGLGVISTTRALRQKQAVDCACMGATFKFPLSKVTVIENASMFIMAIGMLVTMQFAHGAMTMGVVLGQAGLS